MYHFYGCAGYWLCQYAPRAPAIGLRPIRLRKAAIAARYAALNFALRRLFARHFAFSELWCEMNKG